MADRISVIIPVYNTGDRLSRCLDSMLAQSVRELEIIAVDDGSTDNPRSIVVTEDIGFTAIFAVNNYTVTANSNSPVRGSVTGGGTYSYQSVATLTALPADHHHFVQWDDADTNNPRTLTVISDTSFTAHFVKIDIALVSDGTSTPDIPDGISEMSAARNAVPAVLYDLQGRKAKNARKGIYVTDGKKIVF